MADNGNQGTGDQGQEPGTGTQGQGQESAPNTGDQGQEPGTGSNGPADISKMSPEELGTYAAKLQKDVGLTRAEAAQARTDLKAAQDLLSAAEREKMSEAERIQADLEAQKGTVSTLTEENTTLKAQVEDLTKGVALRDVLREAGALNPATAFKVGDWSGVKLDGNGALDTETAKAALQALKKSDPYLFRRGANANAGDGRDAAPAGDGGGINDMIRGGRRG